MTVDCPASVWTFKEHAYCVYSAIWNPRHATVFASASGDCTALVWDVREPGSTMIIPTHEFEILSSTTTVSSPPPPSTSRSR
ncbi:hypothetical protein ACLB2K_066871 [Fragaria x ananassa]